VSHSVQLKPRPLRKPGLFFEVEAEVEHLTSKASCTWLALAHLPHRLPALAWHAHHLAAVCASDRGQLAPTRGVEQRDAASGY
jgi:hypothetical protein